MKAGPPPRAPPTRWTCANRPEQAAREQADAHRAEIRGRSRIMTALVCASDINSDERSSRVEAKGDESIGSRLEKLTAHGWSALHAVPTSGPFTAIHYFEVALRNTIDVRLVKDYSGSQSWFDAPAMPLSEGDKSKVRQAKWKVTAAGHQVTHGRVLTELPLDFWWTLFAESYNRTLWAPSLRQAFPRARRDRLHSRSTRSGCSTTASRTMSR